MFSCAKGAIRQFLGSRAALRAHLHGIHRPLTFAVLTNKDGVPRHFE